MTTGTIADRLRKLLAFGNVFVEAMRHCLSNYVRHSHGGPPSACLGAYLTPPSSPFIGSGQAHSPSVAHHPWCQRQCPSLRWIRAKAGCTNCSDNRFDVYSYNLDTAEEKLLVALSPSGYG